MAFNICADYALFTVIITVLLILLAIYYLNIDSTDSSEHTAKNVMKLAKIRKLIMFLLTARIIITVLVQILAVTMTFYDISQTHRVVSLAVKVILLHFVASLLIDTSSLLLFVYHQSFSKEQFGKKLRVFIGGMAIQIIMWFWRFIYMEQLEGGIIYQK